jgi:hypothetical protein
MLDQNGRTVRRRRCGRLRPLSRRELARRERHRLRRAEVRASRPVPPFRQGAKIRGGFTDGMWPVLDARGVEIGVAVSRREAREQAQRLTREWR